MAQGDKRRTLKHANQEAKREHFNESISLRPEDVTKLDRLLADTIPGLLSTDEAAALAKKPPETIHNLIHEGTLPAIDGTEQPFVRQTDLYVAIRKLEDRQKGGRGDNARKEGTNYSTVNNKQILQLSGITERRKEVHRTRSWQRRQRGMIGSP